MKLTEPVKGDSEQHRITQLLRDWDKGSPGAETDLMEAVYPRLRRLARKHMAGERTDHSLQATALVHEAYEKLVDQRHKSWQNRLHFFAAASELMRRILVDHARRRKAEKRGGGRPHLTFDDASILLNEQSDTVLALNDALADLNKLSPRQERIVVLRFFGGLEQKEIAKLMDISLRTVKREWCAARAWLYGEVKRQVT